MATLTQDQPRAYGVSDDLNEVPVIASHLIFEGCAVGDNGAGLARKLVALDPFVGFAKEQCDNSTGAASARNVKVWERGKVVLNVTGVASADDVGQTVYASDDNAFTLTSTGNTAIGKVARWISGTQCVVYFEGIQVRSL